MLALGLGRGASRERRSLVGFILNLISGFSQITIVIVILALSGTRFKSPTNPELTEWKACSRPLGPWACLWVIRVVIATSLNYWGFLRERHLLARRRERAESVPINGENRGNAPSGRPTETARTPRALENASSIARDQVSLTNTQLYSRLTLFSSLLTLSWFLTAHILTYTSISTCRHSSPHNWWLVFGILCLMYLIILEVVVLGFVVFIVAPILFLFWNIVLFCMGRHPLQIHSTIKPEVGKLSKSIVDTIPLVLYIPPPPGYIPQQQNVSVQVKPDTLGSKSAPAESEPKRRFWIMKCLTSVNTPKDQKIPKSKEDEFDENIGEPQAWEEYWEQGEYPFVILEENRAACAICLVDFVEPKRIWADNNSIVPKTESNPNPVTEAAVTVDVSKPILDAVSASGNNDHATTKLVDAGEGMQPLRLLACGHVFHKSCLDPWLLDISGRCPVCQRVVKVPEDMKPRKGRHRDR
ncbi:hypothetical protein J132_05666 [Termitomyces sp. J132]|nr:hypothetical protein J132_05666 [Termitomyces sp. J132]